MTTHIHSSLIHKTPAAVGDRADLRPRHVRWSDEHTWSGKVWMTDGEPWTACANAASQRIHWLLEPRELHPENYGLALGQLRNGDLIFTHDAELLAMDDPHILPYPHGGTRLHPSDWVLSSEKPKAVSIVASPKRSMSGHALRHELIEKVGRRIDAYGPQYTPIEHKADALLPYRYHVAIENTQNGVWFTEALLDCFLTGTIPVYWGSTDALLRWGFDLNGVVLCQNLYDLTNAVNLASIGEIWTIEPEAIERNFIRAHDYTCPEDWLYRYYERLF